MDPYTWFYVFVAVFLAVGFIAQSKPQDAVKAALKDFTFPRSNEGDCVNYVAGTVKLRAPNVLWTGGFSANPVSKKVSTGIFTSKKVVVSYDYYIGMQLGLCLGPGVRVRKIWFGKHLAWSGTLTGGSAIVINNLELFGGEEKNGGVIGTVYFYDGQIPQVQDAFLAHYIGAGCPRYNGVAHLVFTENVVTKRGFYFGKSTNIEPVSVEVDRFPNTLGVTGGKHIMANGLDANPACVIYELCTDEFALLGVDPARLDIPSFVTAAETLYDENHYMSLQISQPARGGDLIAELLKQINGVLYQDTATGKFVLGLQRQDYDSLDLQEIDVDSLSDIANYTRNMWSDTMNQVRVMFQNRNNNYMENSPAVWQDTANVAQSGKVRSAQISHPGCYDPDLAVFLATRNGAALSVPLFSCDVKVNRTAGQHLRPNAVFRLTCRRLGIRKLVMRVREVDLGEYDDGKITVSAFQDVYASNVVTIAPPDPTDWEPPNNDPVEITDYAVIGTPYYFAKMLEGVVLLPESSDGLIWVLPRRPSDHSLTFSAYSSTDNFTTNTKMVSSVLYAGAAKLESNYADTVAFNDGFDNSGTGLIVYDLDGVFEPETLTDGDIQNGANLMLIGNEIMAYRTVTNLGGGRYRLTNIRRALFDTTFEAHILDSNVFFLSSPDGISDGQYGVLDTPEIRITDITDKGGLPLADANDIAFSMAMRTFRPAPPTYLTIGGTRQPATVTNSTSPAIDIRTRNRVNSDVAFFNDSSDTAEAGTDYHMRWRVNGGSWTVVDPWTPGSTITLGPTTGLLEIEAWSRRDGNDSRVAVRGTSTVV
jgi:hypothetical protein